MSLCFFFNDTATTEIYTLSLHDALPICHRNGGRPMRTQERVVGLRTAALCAALLAVLATLVLAAPAGANQSPYTNRSEEHTSELQSRLHIVCRLLLEKKNTYRTTYHCSP